MFIPVRKEVHIITPVNGNRGLVFDNELITEVAHAFENQYVWAREVATDVYQSLINGINKKIFIFNQTPNKDGINGVRYNIEKGVTPTCACFRKIDNDGILNIDIYVQVLDRFNKSERETIQDIYSAITHELNHGKVYWERYLSDIDYEKIPEWYGQIHDTLLKSKDNDIYSFGYAMYCTVPEEVYAMVSQTWADMEKRNLTKDNFYERFKETNTYLAYSLTSSVCDKFFNDESFRKKVLSALQKEKIDIKDINSFVKKMKNIAIGALRTSLNNAYCYSDL